MARNVPEWWISSNEAVKEYLYRVAKKGRVSVAGHSAGGREILMYEFGEKEDLPQKVSFSSAYAAKKPELYTRASERRKPVLFIYAAIHGAEIEGCASLMNLVNLLEKGYDLLGRENEALLSLARQYRLVIVPLSQPDGRARFKLDALQGESLETFQFYAHGIWKDGRPCTYPWHKEVMPLPVSEMKQLGAYFNDNGVNCQHDDFFGDMQPEVRTLVDIVHAERPDCILSCHACEAEPGLCGPAFSITPAADMMTIQISNLTITHQTACNLRPYCNINIKKHNYFLLQDILYLASGALPLMYEFQHGCDNFPYTLQEIVDTGLILFEEIMRFGAKNKFMPRF